MGYVFVLKAKKERNGRIEETVEIAGGQAQEAAACGAAVFAAVGGCLQGPGGTPARGLEAD